MTALIEVRVDTLTGPALDWAVAQIEGRKTRIYVCPIDGEYRVAATVPDGDLEEAWLPSLSWSQGGPLIEKQQITLDWDGVDGEAFWWKASHQEIVQFQIGDTPLIAAMRAIVAANLGDTVTVSVPAELVQAVQP